MGLLAGSVRAGSPKSAGLAFALGALHALTSCSVRSCALLTGPITIARVRLRPALASYRIL
jgi:hypothetical protein